MQMMKRNLKRQQGLTLIEIMVVVVILGILAAIIVPQIMSRPDQAREVKAKQDIMAVESALNLYRLDNGFYPSTDQGLKALVTKPTTPPQPMSWKSGGYLKQLPVDPWGRDYHFINKGNGKVEIFTYGANGQPGGTGINATVSNITIETKKDSNAPQQ